jgi:beta-lactamase regulating signal transducer with metallopeptidase domain
VRDVLPWTLLAAWSLGAAVTSWTAWSRWTRFQRLLAHAGPAPLEWQSLAARISRELSIRNPPDILVAPGRLPPLVVPGWRRSRMLLPQGLLGRLNGRQRAALLMHELVHIKRGDHWARILELIVDVAYWWLPFAGQIGRRLRLCEEKSCDAAVVARLPEARRDYARLLLDVLDYANPRSPQEIPQITAMSAANDLEQRLRAILDGARRPRRAWPAGVLTVGMALAILPCGLRCDVVGRPVSFAVSDACDPAAAAAPLPSGAREGKPIATYCCPT